MTERILTCIECPRGCVMTVTQEGTKVIDVKNNFCIKGKRYAENECVCPMRTITTTIRLADGDMLPVKTHKEVKKSKIFEIMNIINKVTASKPVVIGQALLRNIDGEGTDLIATKDM